MAAGDTFRAAASDQLEIWAERTGCEIVVAEKENAKASSGRQIEHLMKLFFLGPEGKGWSRSTHILHFSHCYFCDALQLLTCDFKVLPE